MSIRSIFRGIPCVRRSGNSRWMVRGSILEVFLMAAACLEALEQRGCNMSAAKEGLGKAELPPEIVELFSRLAEEEHYAGNG